MSFINRKHFKYYEREFRSKAQKQIEEPDAAKNHRRLAVIQHIEEFAEPCLLGEAAWDFDQIREVIGMAILGLPVGDVLSLDHSNFSDNLFSDCRNAEEQDPKLIQTMALFHEIASVRSGSQSRCAANVRRYPSRFRKRIGRSVLCWARGG